jgi:hypothetical protein
MGKEEMAVPIYEIFQRFLSVSGPLIFSRPIVKELFA